MGSAGRRRAAEVSVWEHTGRVREGNRAVETEASHPEERFEGVVSCHWAFHLVFRLVFHLVFRLPHHSSFHWVPVAMPYQVADRVLDAYPLDPSEGELPFPDKGGEQEDEAVIAASLDTLGEGRKAVVTPLDLQDRGHFQEEADFSRLVYR